MKFFRHSPFVVFGILVLLCFVKLRQYQAEPSKEQIEATQSNNWPDDLLDENMEDANKGSEGFTLFLLFMVTAVVGGFLFVPRILSKFGDAVGEAVLASGEEAKEDPYATARSLVANGDYEEAVASFREISKDHPGDRLPVLEMVKLFQDKMDQPQNAILTLETALRQDQWDEEDRAVFMFKTVDLYLDHTDNQQAAVKVLKDIVTTFPKTRHASNATHRLREIDPSQIPSATPSASPSNPSGPQQSPSKTEPPKPNV